MSYAPRTIVLFLTLFLFILTAGSASAQEEVDVDTTDLDETFVSDDGTTTFDYPDGWRVDEGDANIFGLTDGDESIFENPDDEQAIVVLVIYPDGEIPSRDSGDPVEVIEWVMEDLDMGAPFDDAEEIEIDGIAAARAFLDSEDVDSMLVAFEIDNDVYGVMNIVLAPGELRRLDETLYGVISTVQFDEDGGFGEDNNDEIELTEDYTTDDEQFSFSLPEDWFYYETDADGSGRRLVIISNVEDVEVAIPDEGVAFGLMLISSVSTATGERLSRDEEERPIDAMQALNDGSPDLPFSDPEGFELDGRFGALTVGDYDDFDNIAYILMLNDDDYAYVNAYTGADEIEDFEPIFLAVLASVELEN